MDTIDLDMKTCATCEYFVDARTSQVMNDLDGECHRFPPTLVPDHFDGYCASFTAVNFEDWCGEYIGGDINETGRRS